MALYEDKLSLAVEKMGRYFSIVSKESFMAILAFGEEDSIGDFGQVNFDPAPAQEKLARVFTDSTEGGAIIVDVVQALKDLTSSLSSDEEEELWKDAQSLYFFVGEPDTFDTIESDTRKPCSPISVADFCAIEDAEGAINSTYSSPTKFSPNLSAVSVIPVRLTPAQRDTGAVALFLNAIPNLEFSRCVPYLDIVLVTPQKPLSNDNRIQSMGLMQFLRGQEQVAPDSVNATIAGAMDLSALGDYFERMEQMQAAGDEEGLEDLMDEGVSTAGMEIFTAPQTLVNADEQYADYSVYQTVQEIDEAGNPTGETTSVGGKRGAPVIDRFRPFMAVDSFNVTVTPSKGMMSHKTADLTLVLFDRSRLTEIAPFVKPDLYGRTEMLITYGWSHPQDTAAVVDLPMGGGTALAGNFYGTFLNALKVQEKYGIVNSSFSFDEVGQVKIKLKLSMKGASNIDTTNISKGEGVDEVLEQMKLLADAIKELKGQIASDAEATGTDMADVTGGTFLGAAGDTSSAMAIDEETQEAIAKFISDNRNAEEGSTEDELVDNLTAMFGEDGTGGVVSEAKATIAAAVGAKMSQMKAYRQANKDPFMRAFTGSGGSTEFINVPWASNDFVSLGSVLMYFIGKPLASTKRFDEVQFVFYGFNDKASYLKDCSIAQFPLKIENFEKKFTEITKNTANIPLGKFLGFLNKEFIHNQAAYIYGLASLYETDDEGNQKLSEEMTEDATALNNEKKMRLEDAYGSEEDIMFKMPRITMHIETVPIKPSATNGGAKGTILRIHLYDSQSTKYSALGKMMQGARSDSIGMISSAASAAVNASSTDAEPGTEEYEQNANHQNEFIELLQSALDFGLLEAVPELVGVELDSSGNYSVNPEEFSRNYFRIKGGFPALKGFIQASMPTIIYGSQNSAVIKADLSSMNNSKLATINMQRSGMGGGTGAQGSRDTGLPLQTAPTKLSLTTLGCPIVSYGQNFFVDFGTGTTVDNVYVVSGIGHSISQGKFETKLKMTQVDAFGKFMSAFQAVEGALTALSDAAEDED